MSKKPTAKAASNLNGPKLYHQRARLALPILVRQAKAMEPIFYGDLAMEIGMPNARNLNYPLGSIGRSLNALGKEMKIEIPMIQSLVINKSQNLPGDGIGSFMMQSAEKYKRLPKQKRKKMFEATHIDVYAYKDWDLVLQKLGLNPVDSENEKLIKGAKGSRGGGEGKEHQRLKNYVYKHPELFRISNVHEAKEEKLASGDRIDVSFVNRKSWTGIEVKSIISNIDDLTRGVFQIVKYNAVMSAELAAKGHRSDVNTMLVIESQPIHEIVGLANTLSVKIIWVKRKGEQYEIISGMP